MMLTRDELIRQLAVTFGKTKVDRLSAMIKAQQFDLNELIDLTFYPDPAICFRAAWLMDEHIRRNPESCIDTIKHLVARIPQVKNHSCKRHYTRIMMRISMPEAPENVRDSLAQLDLEAVVEQFFDWLIDPKVKVAVKIFAAEALFNLSGRYDWIKEELGNQIEFMLRNGGPAIQSRGRKLLTLIRN